MQGENGSDPTFSAARALCWGFCIDQATALGLLLAHYNPRCSPPWSISELQHKVKDGDERPFTKPRGWLLDENRTNGFHGRPASEYLDNQAPWISDHYAPPFAGVAEVNGQASTPPTGYDIILRHFRLKFDPTFRRGTYLYSRALGREVRQGEALAGAGKDLIDQLETASDAPRNESGVKRVALPYFFRTWAPSAWVDLLASLPSPYAETSTKVG